MCCTAATTLHLMPPCRPCELLRNVFLTGTRLKSASTQMNACLPYHALQSATGMQHAGVASA